MNAALRSENIFPYFLLEKNYPAPFNNFPFKYLTRNLDDPVNQKLVLEEFKKFGGEGKIGELVGEFGTSPIGFTADEIVKIFLNTKEFLINSQFSIIENRDTPESRLISVRNITPSPAEQGINKIKRESLFNNYFLPSFQDKEAVYGVSIVPNSWYYKNLYWPQLGMLISALNPDIYITGQIGCGFFADEDDIKIGTLSIFGKSCGLYFTGTPSEDDEGLTVPVGNVTFTVSKAWDAANDNDSYNTVPIF